MVALLTNSVSSPGTNIMPQNRNKIEPLPALTSIRKMARIVRIAGNSARFQCLALAPDSWGCLPIVNASDIKALASAGLIEVRAKRITLPLEHGRTVQAVGTRWRITSLGRAAKKMANEAV